jgi:arsenate reductase
MITVYGISNCDTVKKALKWLNNNHISYEFHDFKKQGLSDDLLSQFAAKSDWQALVNKRSTTFRNLAPAIKENLTDQAAFKAVMEQPTLLKRPVLIHNDQLHLGFKETQYQALFIQA